MAVGAARRSYSYAGMSRINRMQCRPGAGMTGGTIGRYRVAKGCPNQGAAAGVMTARARVMRICCCA